MRMRPRAEYTYPFGRSDMCQMEPFRKTYESEDLKDIMVPWDAVKAGPCRENKVVAACSETD